MARTPKKEIWHCIKCGASADVRYKKEWYCGDCLNPEPTTEYLKREREQMNGQWGGVNIDVWNVM